jgi:hypothetical protein
VSFLSRCFSWICRWDDSWHWWENGIQATILKKRIRILSSFSRTDFVKGYLMSRYFRISPFDPLWILEENQRKHFIKGLFFKKDSALIDAGVAGGSCEVTRNILKSIHIFFNSNYN